MAIMYVFKYVFTITDSIILTMPASAQILDVQIQYGNPCIWALVNPDNPPVERVFRLAGTGHPIESEDVAHYTHISTFQMEDGALIFHLFEVKGDTDA